MAIVAKALLQRKTPLKWFSTQQLTINATEIAVHAQGQGEP